MRAPGLALVTSRYRLKIAPFEEHSRTDALLFDIRLGKRIDVFPTIGWPTANGGFNRLFAVLATLALKACVAVTSEPWERAR